MREGGRERQRMEYNNPKDLKKIVSNPFPAKKTKQKGAKNRIQWIDLFSDLVTIHRDLRFMQPVFIDHLLNCIESYDSNHKCAIPKIGVRN